MRHRTNLGGVHLVDGDDELPDTEGEGKESVLSGLAIFGDTSLELTGTTSNDKDGTVSLGGTSNHVFDEITVWYWGKEVEEFGRAVITTKMGSRWFTPRTRAILSTSSRGYGGVNIRN